jgi:hypothetical protein
MSKCKSCNAEIVWLKSGTGRNVPVDAETYHGEDGFDHKLHRSHFATCPDADKFRKAMIHRPGDKRVSRSTYTFDYYMIVNVTEMIETKRFWTVKITPICRPTCIHLKKEIAEAEIVRLKSKFPDQEFMLFKGISHMKLVHTGDYSYSGFVN